MPRNVRKAFRRLAKWHAETCQALSRAACSGDLVDNVHTILRKTASIFKTIKGDTFDKEQRGQLSRELLTILCQVSSNLHFRARDLLLAGDPLGVNARFNYWNIQCALLSYVVDLALAVNEPSAISKVLFTLSKSKHRVWDVLVQTEAIASTAVLDERDRMFDVFRWLTTYCPRTCSNPELYFKFVACAACLSRRLPERGWKTVKSTAMAIEPAEFDFEEWFAAQPALVALLPPSAVPMARRKVIAQLCKCVPSHAELLKACEAISESSGVSGANIRSSCDAEATEEDDFFTILDDALEARDQATTSSQIEDEQLQVILEATLSRMHSSLASPHATDNEPNSELISEASFSPLNTRAFLQQLLSSSSSAGDGASAAPEDVQKPRKRLDYAAKESPEEAGGLDGTVADEGDRSEDDTQERASEDESCAEATPDALDSPHKTRKQRGRKHQRKAMRGKAVSAAAETVEECGVPSSVSSGNEVGEPSSLQPSGQKCAETAPLVSAADFSDPAAVQHNAQTPLKRSKRYGSTNESPMEDMRDMLAPQGSLSKVRPLVSRLSSQENERKLKVRSCSQGEPTMEAVGNCRSKVKGAKKARECQSVDYSVEEPHDESSEGSSADLAPHDASAKPLSLSMESDGEVPCSGSESAGSEVCPSVEVVNAASPERKNSCTGGEVASPKITRKLKDQLGSEVDSVREEVVSRRSNTATGSSRARQRAIIISSDEEFCSEENIEESDVQPACSDADESSGTERSCRAKSSGSESAGSQVGPATKVVNAASVRRQSGCIASTSPENSETGESSSSSDENGSAEEIISRRSSQASGARKARRLQISDSSDHESYSEQNLEHGAHLASGKVKTSTVMRSRSVRENQISGSDSESEDKNLLNQSSPRSSVKKRAPSLASSNEGTASVGRRMVHSGRCRISSSSEEELHVKYVSKGRSELSRPKCARELKTPSESECQSPEENSDDQNATSSMIKKDVTARASLSSSGRAARSSLSLRKTVSRASKELRSRIGEPSVQEPRTNQVTEGNKEILASGHTGRHEVPSSSKSESLSPLIAPASQTAGKILRRIVSSSESSEDEHDAEDPAQPDAGGSELPSEFDDDEIPCGQRAPSISSLQHTPHSSVDSESEEGPYSPKPEPKRHVAANSDADTVDVPSCDDEVSSEKRSTARFSQTTIADTSPKRHSESPSSQLQGPQTYPGGYQAESDVNAEAKQGCIENSVFKVPTHKRARTVSRHREAESMSRGRRSGLDEFVASSLSSYERSAAEKTKPVADAAFTRTRRSCGSELSQDGNLAEFNHEGVAPGPGDTGMSASLDRGTSMLEDVPHVRSGAISSNQKKASIDEKISDAQCLHNARGNTNDAPAFEALVSLSSLKTEQAAACEGTQNGGRRRTAPRKRSTSGPSHSEKLMSSMHSTDISHSGQEVSAKQVQPQPSKSKQSYEVEPSEAVTSCESGHPTLSESESSGRRLSLRVAQDFIAGRASKGKQRQSDGNKVLRTKGSQRQYSGAKSSQGEEIPAEHDYIFSDDSDESESPKKDPGSSSNEKLMSSVTRRKLRTRSENSSPGTSKQEEPSNLLKSLSSSGKRHTPSKLVVQIRRSWDNLVNGNFSPGRIKAAEREKAERPGKAPKNLEQASSSSGQGHIIDDSIEWESPIKRPCSISSKSKLALSGRRQKSDANLEVAKAHQSRQFLPSCGKSPHSPVRDDIPLRVLTRSARKRLSTSREASVSPEKNRTAESRAGIPDKASDTLGAASAWETLRNVSEGILDSDAESTLSSVIDHISSVTTDRTSAAIEEKQFNGHKEDGLPKRRSARVGTSQALRLRSTKNDVEAVAPAIGSRASPKVHSGSGAAKNESIDMPNGMLGNPEQCSTQNLSQSSNNLTGLTQAPSRSSRLSADLPSFQREADKPRHSQRGLGKLVKDSGNDTTSLTESGDLSRLSQNKDSSVSPKADLSLCRAEQPGSKSGRLSLTARRSQSGASESPKISPTVSSRQAGVNRALEEPVLSAATRTRRSSNTSVTNPGSKQMASEVKKRPTRASASRSSQTNKPSGASALLPRRVFDATDVEVTPSKASVTRRSARLSVMRGSPGSQTRSSRLAAITQKGSAIEDDGSSTRSSLVPMSPIGKGSSTSHCPAVPGVELQDINTTKRRSRGACLACQRSSPVTQDSGTMTDDSYLHDEADFSNSLTSTKRRKTGSVSSRAASQQKTVTSESKSRQSSTTTRQPNVPVRRSTRASTGVSRRLSYT